VSIPFFIILHFIILKRTKSRAIKFANFEALARVTGGKIMNKNLTILVLRLWAFIFIIMAASGTILSYNGETTESDYILAIDTSSSMLADDLVPNRLKAAKEAAISFLETIPSGGSVGLVTFAGTAYAEQFLIQDYSLLRDAIDEIQPSRVSGTDLSNAVVTSTNLLINSERPKSIILLTDGQGNIGVALDQAVMYAKKNQVVVHTIAIGTEKGGRFIRLDLVSAMSKMDNEALLLLSEGTGGLSYVAVNQQQIVEAYLAIATIKKQLIPWNLQLPSLLLALLLLFIEWGLLNTRFRTLP